jgi:magnesium transporter
MRSENVIAVRPHTHQERAALLALEHSLKAIPVTDKDGKLLGVVPSDVILTILHSEHVHDTLLSAGISPSSDPAATLLKAPATTHFRRRLPWLLVGLAGGVFAAGVVSAFHASLEAQIVLASFIPVVVYIADAVGSQSQTVFIRSMTLDTKLDVMRYATREARVSLMLAGALALILAAVGFVWMNSPFIGTVLGLSIFSTVLVSTAVALFLPCFFSKLKFDPAVASGPFATIVRDITNLFIYFTIASSMIAAFS